jgi:hypothetical protein
MTASGEITRWQAAVARMHRRQPASVRAVPPQPTAIRVDLDTHREAVSLDSEDGEFEQRTRVVVAPFMASGGHQRDLYYRYLLGGIPPSFSAEAPGREGQSSEEVDSESDSQDVPVSDTCRRYVLASARRVSPGSDSSPAEASSHESPNTQDRAFIKSSGSESSLSAGNHWRTATFSSSGSSCVSQSDSARGTTSRSCGESVQESVGTLSPSRAPTPATGELWSECDELHSPDPTWCYFPCGAQERPGTDTAGCRVLFRIQVRLSFPAWGLRRGRAS